jgi:hypothetical protein
MWGMDWIDLAQDRNRWWALVNAVMNFCVTYNAGHFLTTPGTVNFARRTLHHDVTVADRMLDRYFTFRWYDHTKI